MTIEAQSPVVLCALINALETESREFQSLRCREMLTDLVKQIEGAGLAFNQDLRLSIEAAKKTLAQK